MRDLNSAIPMKMTTKGRKKKMYCVLDCESLDIMLKGIAMHKTTANWGMTLGDKNGNMLYTQDWIIEDVYNQPSRNIITNFYTAKLQKIEQDETTAFVPNFKAFYDLLREFWATHGKYYDIEFWSYNGVFDKDALTKNAEYFMTEVQRDTEFEKWYEENWFCIQNLACHTILATDEYKLFCIANMLITEGGSYQTGAEACYKYITGNAEFIEDHTGMSDSKIEYEILLECLQYAKDNNIEITHDMKKLISGAWRIVNPKSIQTTKKFYGIASKGQIFWEKANNKLPVGAYDYKYIQDIDCVADKNKNCNTCQLNCNNCSQCENELV